MANHNLGFVHRFVTAEETRVAPRVHTEDVSSTTASTAATLVLLHGTGGDENDLLPLGVRLAAGAGVNLLSPRGRVSEGEAARFFRRFREGIFDEADVERRAHELADFVRDAAVHYGFDASRAVAVGYSNGANIAAATMLFRPGTFSAAVLFHAQPVLSNPPVARLNGKSVFLSGGLNDPIVSASETNRLAELLRAAGAEVKLSWQHAGHSLTSIEVEEARVWLSERQSII